MLKPSSLLSILEQIWHEQSISMAFILKNPQTKLSVVKYN